MKNLITREIAVVALLGAAPVVLALAIGGTEEMGDTISALLGSELLIYYSFALLLGYLLVCGLDYFFLFVSPAAKGSVSFLRAVLRRAGSGLLGIYRLATGVLIAFPLIWIAFERSQEAVTRGGAMLTLGLACFVMVIFLAALDDKLAKNR